MGYRRFSDRHFRPRCEYPWLKADWLDKNSRSWRQCEAEEYFVNFVAPNELGFPFLRVTKGKLHPSIDFLIGMDIISRGDLLICNYSNKTTLSFRIPSINKVDLQQLSTLAPDKDNIPSPSSGQIARNALCPCGSGKKYKRCHGKLPWANCWLTPILPTLSFSFSEVLGGKVVMAYTYKNIGAFQPRCFQPVGHKTLYRARYRQRSFAGWQKLQSLLPSAGQEPVS